METDGVAATPLPHITIAVGVASPLGMNASALSPCQAPFFRKESGSSSPTAASPSGSLKVRAAPPYFLLSQP